METQVSVAIPTRQFLALADFLRSNDDPRDPVHVVETAIEYWLDNAGWKSELLSQSQALGYQWKNMFLPDGTEVRMQYKGQYHYARVAGDQLLYQDRPTTPGSLANLIAGSSRNAWRDLWVKRPTDREWRLSYDCRAEGTTGQVD